MLKEIFIFGTSLKITNSILQQHLPGANVLIEVPVLDRKSHLLISYFSRLFTCRWYNFVFLWPTGVRQPCGMGQGPVSLTFFFFIAIQIRWKFRFTLISILIEWSLQNFVHGMTAMLSWHVQKNCRDLMASKGLTARWSCHRIWIAGKKIVSETGPRMWLLWLLNTLRLRQNGRHFCRRHFEFHFLEWKLFYFDLNFTEIYSQGSNWQYSSTGLGGDVTPSKWQAIIWTNDGLVCWHIYIHPSASVS